MARITAYQATDKALFADKKAYIQHQTDINAAEAIAGLVHESIKDGEEPVFSTKEEVIAYIAGHITSLREILSRRYNPSEKDVKSESDAGEPRDEI